MSGDGANVQATKGADESRINRWARSSITTCIFGVTIDPIDPVTRARGTGQRQ